MRAINLGAGVVALLLISSSFLHSAALAGPIHDPVLTPMRETSRTKRLCIGQPIGARWTWLSYWSRRART
jgi:hypothetical protein